MNVGIINCGLGNIHSISKCIDFTTIGNNDSIALTFETRMYSGFLNEYSWIRVKVDGNVISDNLGNIFYIDKFI